jgi:hypothetical protein
MFVGLDRLAGRGPRSEPSSSSAPKVPTRGTPAGSRLELSTQRARLRGPHLSDPSSGSSRAVQSAPPPVENAARLRSFVQCRFI